MRWATGVAGALSHWAARDGANSSSDGFRVFITGQQAFNELNKDAFLFVIKQLPPAALLKFRKHACFVRKCGGWRVCCGTCTRDASFYRLGLLELEFSGKSQALGSFSVYRHSITFMAESHLTLACCSLHWACLGRSVGSEPTVQGPVGEVEGVNGGLGCVGQNKVSRRWLQMRQPISAQVVTPFPHSAGGVTLPGQSVSGLGSIVGKCSTCTHYGGIGTRA